MLGEEQGAISEAVRPVGRSRVADEYASGVGSTSQCHMPTAFMTMERPSMYARMPTTCVKKKGRGFTK